MSLRDWRLRLRALLAPSRVERELDEELAFHVERETQKLISQGLRPSDARAAALARFGSVALAADECRDTRGTAFIDNTVRDIQYAFRTFSRAPLAAVTIIGTVALGLGLITVVFTLYNAFFLRVDAVADPERLFAIDRPTQRGARTWIQITRPHYEAIRRDTSVFTDVLATNSAIALRVNGRRTLSTLVTGNFFQVLGVRAALGRTLLPEDDERNAPRQVVVLSHRGWHKLFDGDETVIGRSVPVNGVPHEIVGVMPEDFRGLALLVPDYWAPLGLISQFRRGAIGKEDEIFLDTVVGRLKPGLSAEGAAATLTAWAAGRPDLPRAGSRQPVVTLTPSHGTMSADLLTGLKAFLPLFLAFGLILMIGCANVANLLLARAVARQREIGVRLSLGASRRRLVRQLMTESLLLALASAACGFAISRVFMDAAIRLAVTTMPPEMADALTLSVPVADWRVGVFLVCGALVSTIVFGLLPALQATRLELVRTMRGEVVQDGRPGRARHALIALQVGASAMLLICAAVFLRSAVAAAKVDAGIRTSDTVIVPIVNEAKRAALLREVAAHPSVAAIAASSPAPLEFIRAATATTEPATSGGRSVEAPVGYQFVSPEYFGVLEIEILKGRGFTADERSADSGVVIVSELMVKRLWPDGNPLGRIVRLQADQPADPKQPDAPRPPARNYEVIGIARNVGYQNTLLSFDGAGVYIPISADAGGTSLTLRVHGDPVRARAALLDRLTVIDPAFTDIKLVKTQLGISVYILRAAFWITVILGALALALTVSGLFSVLSYLVEQRSKEIGVRMALGATAGDVTGLVLWQSVAPVALGLAAGAGLSVALARTLMAGPWASGSNAFVRVLDPAAYIASLLVITAACALAASVPARRAARIDPIATLRRD